MWIHQFYGNKILIIILQNSNNLKILQLDGLIQKYPEIYYILMVS